MTATIRLLPASEAEAKVPELAALLVDAVAGGASVNFMAGLHEAEAAEFWRGQLPGLASGERLLFVAEQGGVVVGSAVLTLAQQPNAPHRAEVGKMLVLSTARRQGLGRRLLQAVEAHAASIGRTLLMLDTQAGSPGDLLYRDCDWIAAGTVPGHAFTPDGRLAATALFFKQLGAPA